MLVIGLTGGIGSGKSTVANLFAEKGIEIIDTDQIARKLTAKDTDCLTKIVARFGKHILLADENLNRATLRSIIFNNAEDRQWLESLLHPLIRKQMETLIANCQSPYCIAVIPLLFENKPHPLIHRILVIDATEEQQIQRTQQRDNILPAHVRNILITQATRKIRLRGADDIIYNHGTLNDLKAQVDTLHDLYLRLACNPTIK